MEPVSAVADPATAAAMIWAWVVRLCTRASIRPLAELVEVENSRHQNDEAQEVQQNDTARQPLGRKTVQQAAAACDGQVETLNLLALVALIALKRLGCRGLIEHFAPSQGRKSYCSLKR